jgi:hypothetical protein
MVSMSPWCQTQFLGAPTGRHEGTLWGTIPVSNNRRQNNALHQTRRRGVAHFVRRRPVVEGRLAGERECWAGSRGCQ